MKSASVETDLTVLRGKLKKISDKQLVVPGDYFFVDASRSQQGKTVQQGFAVGLAVLGDAASATGALQRSKAEISVHLFEFMVGESRCAGLLASLPFDDGDEVEAVVGQNDGDGPIECFAVARPVDRLIALRPHCVRGRAARRIRVVRRTLTVSTLIACLSFWMTDGPMLQSILWALSAFVACALIWSFIEWRVYVENSAPIYRLTERLLAALGVNEPEWVDLVRLSKRTKTGREPAGYRWQHYRY